MKKRIVTLIIGSLFGISSAGADTSYSQKTFLMPRAVGVNLAMEEVTWHDHVYTLHHKSSKIKSHFQVTPFFQESTNREDIGKYFGIGNGTNSFTVGTAAQVAAGTADVDARTLIHDSQDASATKLAGTVTFKPYQQLYGARLDYVQMMGSPFKNLFFKASMPIVHVENNMAMRIANAQNVTITSREFLDPRGGVNPQGPILETDTFSLNDFFTGNVSVQQGNEEQAPLAKAKINGRRTAFGIADLDIAIGYIVEHTAKRYFAFNVGVTIPTGNRVRGQYLFEPIYGNGHHVGLGGNIDAGFELWKGEYGEVWATMGANYRYLFTATESRTIGVNNLTLGYFQLAGVVGQTNQPLFPLANALTPSLRVKPGSQFESLIDISFKSKQYIVDVGYNMYWKDKETIHIKSFTSGSLGIADPSYVQNIGRVAGVITPVRFTSPAPAGVTTITRLIQDADLDLEAAKTPTQLTHKIFGGFGYRFNINHDYPSSISLGGSYEFTQDNAALEQYAIWVKAAFSF